MRPTADDRARPRSCGDPAKPSRWQAWFNVRIAYGADLNPPHRSTEHNVPEPCRQLSARVAVPPRGTGANDLTAAKASSDGCRPGGQGSAMRGQPLRRRTEIEWLTRAGRFDLAESEISQHHARSERNGDFTSPTSLVTRSKTLFGANSRLAAGQIPKCVGLNLPLRRISAIAAEDGGAQSPDCWLTPNTALSAPSSSPFAYKWKPELNERSFTLPARPKAPAAWQK